MPVAVLEALAMLLCALLATGALLIALRLRRLRVGAAAVAEEARAQPAIGAWRRLGARLRPTRSGEAEALQQRLVHAGLYGRDAIDLFVAVRFVLMVAGLLAVLGGRALLAASSFDQLMLVLVVAAVVVIAPNAWLASRIRRRQREVSEALPDVLDLLVVCLEAGLGLEQALERVVRGGGSPVGDSRLLRQELDTVLSDVQLGMPVAAAWRRLAQRLGGEDVSSVAALIAKASVMGARLGELLRGHSKTVRQRQLLRLEEATGTANAQLALPLTICLLPAAMLLMMGPAALALFRGL